MKTKAQHISPSRLATRIAAARGNTPADVVIKNTKYLDVLAGKFRSGDVAMFDGVVIGVGDAYEAKKVIDGRDFWVVPGFIDSHVHIESSMMTPVRFQQAVLPAGTTTAIWDPHEIANVWGKAGIEWALAQSEGLQLDIFVMLPSCVPSTGPELEFETSGAVLKAGDLRAFKVHPRVLGLAEMMNFPGVLQADADVLTKLSDFSDRPRDGHCPALSGKDLNAYAVAGIHSCHESTTLPEADEKLSKGIHVLIREGSCARDAQTLLPLLNAYTSATLATCSDDRNPLDIREHGHIGAIVDIALKNGHKPEDIFRSVAFGAAQAFHLHDRGVIAPGYVADVVCVAPKKAGAWDSGFTIKHVFKAGQSVDSGALAKLADEKAAAHQPQGANLKLDPVTREHLRVSAPSGKASTVQVKVIEIIPRQILTHALNAELRIVDSAVQADPARDILKIAVFERHHRTGRHTVGFVRGFGLRSGAIATSINHDSHNVICVGANDEAMLQAIEQLRKIDGGIVVSNGSGKAAHLSLPVAGLMTTAKPDEVADRLIQLKALARDFGCALEEPFLTLSFLALPVIPELKITDRGLIDVNKFAKVSLFS